MQLSVLLVTDAMLFNSVTLRLGDMDQESFLSQPLYNYFVDGLAAIIPCPKENVFVFNIQKNGDRIPPPNFTCHVSFKLQAATYTHFLLCRLHDEIVRKFMGL
ncbi:putative Protocadherin wing polarity protein stan [Daphnia magna]|uniref:Putative Protocadherin wing polarity protein stan n=1 Tax=Daphnia magna TaxID=35525 RepID=A0A164X6Q4_9CRUS|nr:putative Protocadherin wing polarity protein stan [Daphnia magna]